MSRGEKGKISSNCFYEALAKMKKLSASNTCGSHMCIDFIVYVNNLRVCVVPTERKKNSRLARRQSRNFSIVAHWHARIYLHALQLILSAALSFLFTSASVCVYEIQYDLCGDGLHKPQTLDRH